MFCTNARRKYFPTKRRTPRARFIFASSACLLYADTQTNASFIFSTSPFYLFFSLSRGSIWVIGFSLAVMQSSRRFEILCSFSFFGVRVFLVSNARERFTHHRTKKTEEEEKKTDCYPKHFFCLFLSRHQAFTLPVGPFLRVTKHPHKTERDHIRFEKKKKKKKKRREEVVILNA